MAEGIEFGRPQRSLIVKGLVPGLAERGKIKIGYKGQMIKSSKGTEFQPPKKLDHFLVTTLQRGEDGNFLRDEPLHQLLGDKPKRIPVRLLFDDIDLNFQCRYACFVGRTLWCTGDGESASRLVNANEPRQNVTCTCERIERDYQGKDKCKINGVLSAMIDGAHGVGGVWKFRTTSWNTVQGLLSSLALIKRITGGVLAGIPLSLTIQPKTVTTPDGSTLPVQVVSLEWAGSEEELQDIGYRLRRKQAEHHVRLEFVEQEARRLLAPPPESMSEEEAADMVEEHYPEQAAMAHGIYNPEKGAPEGKPTRGSFKEKDEPKEPSAEPPAENGKPVLDIPPDLDRREPIQLVRHDGTVDYPFTRAGFRDGLMRELDEAAALGIECLRETWKYNVETLTAQGADATEEVSAHYSGLLQKLEKPKTVALVKAPIGKGMADWAKWMGYALDAVQGHSTLDQFAAWQIGHQMIVQRFRAEQSGLYTQFDAKMKERDVELEAAGR